MTKVELSDMAFLVKSIQSAPARQEEFIKLAREHGMSEKTIKAAIKYLLTNTKK